MAQVLLARAVGASGFEKPVALKMLRDELVDEGDLERLLIEEAKQGARLRHRNLVSVHQLGLCSEGYYVVMEWVDGKNLAKLAAGKPVSVEIALTIAAEIAEALAYVHTVGDEVGPLGLVHRDVSPSNVLVSRTGEVKLSDFGIAKATRLAENTQATIRRGKYAYMSPEQVRGEPLTSQSDQFGFGVLLVELLTGTRPFDGASPIETMDRIREAQAPAFEGVDVDLANLLARCLKRDAADRFPTAAGLVHALTVARWRRPPCSNRIVAEWVAGRLEAPASTTVHNGQDIPRTRPMEEK